MLWRVVEGLKRILLQAKRYNKGTITFQSLSVGDAAYESNWMEFSRPMRLNVVQIIHRSQQPVMVQGLGFFNLNLETFKKVCICRKKIEN